MTDAKVTIERETLQAAIDACILDAVGAALAGCGIPGKLVDEIAPQVLDLLRRDFKSYAALRAALAAQPAEPPSMDTILRNAARRSATVVSRGRLAQPVETVIRQTHDDLRRMGEALDKESPKGLGEKLLCFADDWRTEVERLAQPAELVAEVHPHHLRPNDVTGGHWCREVLLYSGNSPHDWLDGKNTRVKLYAAPPAPAAVPPGYTMVPIEPFPSQRIAGAVALMKASDSDLDCTTDEIAAAYRAMIAAAGEPSHD